MGRASTYKEKEKGKTMRNVKVRALRRLFRVIVNRKNSTATNKNDKITPEKAVKMWKRFKKNYTEGKVIIPSGFTDKEYHGYEN